MTFCKYYGRCGGCSCLDVPYTEQVAQKQKKVEETLTAIFPDIQIKEPVVGPQFGYRSRARFRYSRQGLSFYEEKTNTPVILKNCPVLDSKLNEFLLNPPKLNLWELEDGQLSCISTDNGVVFENNMGWVTVKDRQLPVAGNVFFQSNRILLPELIDFVVKHTVGKSVMDLYSGVGTFSAFLENDFSVTAVEINKRCLSLAKQHLKNTKFFALPVERWNPKIHKVDTVIVDPPRVGLQSSVPALIASWQPEHIIYVSCYLNTLLRDLTRFKALGYTATLAQMLDFYPNTPHVETVVLMSRI